MTGAYNGKDVDVNDFFADFKCTVEYYDRKRGDSYQKVNLDYRDLVASPLPKNNLQPLSLHL